MSGPPPVAAAVCQPLEVFDTPESFLRARHIGPEAPDRDTPAFEIDSDEETEDSCNYSSASEHNYLTVSRHLLSTQLRAPSSEGGGDDEEESDDEDESEDDSDRQEVAPKHETSSGSTPVEVQNISDSDSQKTDGTIDLITDTDGDDVSGTRSDSRLPRAAAGHGRLEESFQARARSPGPYHRLQGAPPRGVTEDGTDQRGRLVSHSVIELDSDTEDEGEQTSGKRSLTTSSSSDADDGPPPRPPRVSPDSRPGSGKEPGRGTAEHNGRKPASCTSSEMNVLHGRSEEHVGRRFKRRIVSESEDSDDDGVCGAAGARRDKAPCPQAHATEQEKVTSPLCRDRRGRFVSRPKTTRSSSSHQRPLSDGRPSGHPSPSKRQQPPPRSRSSSCDQRLSGPSLPAALHSSARAQVNKDWNSSFVPFRCRWRRRNPDDDLPPANSRAQKEARATPRPRRRHCSLESATPLMKKSMCEAKQHTKARLCETPREPRV